MFCWYCQAVLTPSHGSAIREVVVEMTVMPAVSLKVDIVGRSMGTKLNSLAQQAAKTRLFSRLEQPLGWFEDLHFRRTFASSPFSTNPSRT
jgi:hypothetical protein